MEQGPDNKVSGKPDIKDNKAMVEGELVQHVCASSNALVRLGDTMGPMLSNATSKAKAFVAKEADLIVANLPKNISDTKGCVPFNVSDILKGKKVCVGGSFGKAKKT